MSKPMTQMKQLTSSRSNAQYKKRRFQITVSCLLLLLMMLLAVYRWDGFLLPRHESKAQALIDPSMLSERMHYQMYEVNEDYVTGFCISPVYEQDELMIYLMNQPESKVDIQLVILDQEGRIKAKSGLLSPGEMLAGIKVKALEKQFRVEVLAYEQGTHYSAGVLRVKTSWIDALEE